MRENDRLFSIETSRTTPSNPDILIVLQQLPKLEVPLHINFRRHETGPGRRL